MSENSILTKRNIDLVFCIDGTGSMAPCIESVKNNARRFHQEFVAAMTELKSDIDSMRIKIIVFRDYHDDGQNAMEQSPFFELPADNAEFEKCLSDIAAYGGGDGPENGLEALYYAMKSDFNTGSKDRQVIVMFTDADALPLGARKGEANYPKDMVDENGLLEMWSCVIQDESFKLREKNKRLVIFAPDGTKYQKIFGHYNHSTYTPVDMAHGLGDIDFKEIIKVIAASI